MTSERRKSHLSRRERKAPPREVELEYDQRQPSDQNRQIKHFCLPKQFQALLPARDYITLSRVVNSPNRRPVVGEGFIKKGDGDSIYYPDVPEFEPANGVRAARAVVDH